MNASRLHFVRHLWVLMLGVGIGLPVCSLAADKVYVVKKNDSLSAIARRYKVSVTELARYNHLPHPDRILIGQRLKIPSAAPELDASLRVKLDKIRFDPRKWRYIVVHHSGVDVGTVAGMDRYHREERHMENGLAYHFVIGNGRGMKDGEIAIGRRWEKQLDGGHLASFEQNQIAIGICLVGNFDKSSPSRRQMESLEALVSYLMESCAVAPQHVQSHQEINTIYTRCPGRHFPSSFFEKLRGGELATK